MAYLETALTAERTDGEEIQPFLHSKGYDPLQEPRVGRLANRSDDVSLGIDNIIGESLGIRRSITRNVHHQ